MSAHIIAPSQIQKTLKVKASLFNLIIYTKKNKRADYIQNIAQKVIEKFPSRILFISVDDALPKNTLKTAISTLSIPSGEFTITCDLVEIVCSQDMQTITPFIILPNLIPDLPIYLLWAEDPGLDNPLLEKLSAYASRHIFDSESTDDITRFAKVLLQQKEKADISDLNWARIEALREVMATTFRSKEKLDLLLKTKQIKIVYNKTSSTFFHHPQIQALYLQCWLSLQLSLDIKNITFEPIEDPHLPGGMVISVDIITDNDHHFCFKRNSTLPHQISVVYSTPDYCDIPTTFIFPKTESGRSLVKEIYRKGTSQHYLKVLKLLCS